MKRTFTSLFIAVGALYTLHAQTQLQEDFTSPFNPNTAGWVIINNSAPQGTLSWTQGNQTGGNGTLTAYNGSTDDFYMADFMSIPFNSAGGISAWLITPTLTIFNGAVLEFATSTFSSSVIYPDRLQVRMSATNNTVIPTGTTSVGSFTTLMLDINPNLTTSTSSAVSNGSVNGYPAAWTVYSVTVSGVVGTVIGRFAFRYFVDDGGSGGANSRLVAVDAVKFSGAASTCTATVQSHTICTGTSATLVANGAAPGTTYNWLPGGQSTPSIVVTPGSTTSYTLQYTEPSGVCPEKTATVTVGNTINVLISSTSPSICSGSSATLTASGATQYVWAFFPPVQSSSIVVNPTSQTVYTVGGNSGNCNAMATYTLGIYPTPTVAIAGNTTACTTGSTGSATFKGNGASSYAWTSGTTTASGNVFTLNFNSPTTPVTYTINLEGTDMNGCTDTETVTLSAAPKPEITITSSPSVACTHSNFTLTASGAAGYAWSGGGSGSNLSVNTGTAPGTMNYTVTGTTAGCTATATHSQAVVVCNPVGITDSEAYGETAIFPNPFSTEIRITSFAGEVIIYNALGQEVIRQSVGSAGTVNTQSLPKGAYVVKAFNYNGHVVKTMKLVKN